MDTSEILGIVFGSIGFLLLLFVTAVVLGMYPLIKLRDSALAVLKVGTPNQRIKTYADEPYLNMTGWYPSRSAWTYSGEDDLWYTYEDPFEDSDEDQ